jgi:hypothetical protein
MKAVVIYESMYGNTHLVADAIADGLRSEATVELTTAVVPVEQANAELLAGTDLLVVGGPTHVHGMSRPKTREAALEAATKPEANLDLDPDAEGPGLREWFDTVDRVAPAGAAFDTRMSGPAALTGRASKGIAKRLRTHGSTLVVDPMSFLVSKDNHLLPDEAAKAREWGAQLREAMLRRG